MVDNATREEIRELVRRHGAARPDGTLPPVYFRVDGGRTRRKAHKVSARLEPGENTEDTALELLRRATDVSIEHRWVLVRAMAVGDQCPIETISFEGDPDEDEDEEDVPKGQHATSHALARVAMGQQRMILDLTSRIERVFQDILEAQVKGALYQYHSEALQLAGKDGMVREVVANLGPQLVGQLPEILRIAAAYAANQPIPAPVAAEQPPENPGGAFNWHADRVVASAQAIRDLVTANQEDVAFQAAALVRVPQLRQIVALVAPIVGLQVVQPQQPPPAPPPADPPPEPPPEEPTPTTETA